MWQANWVGTVFLTSPRPRYSRQVPVWGQPRADWQMAKILKSQFDPHGVFSRGRFVDRI